MQRPDIVIIGAGVFGLATAWFCLARGMTVTVLEARHVGAGASGGLIGALSPHTPEKWNAKKAFQLDALCAARTFWPMIADVSGQNPLYRRAGRYLPLHDSRALELAQMRKVNAIDLWKDAADWNIVPEAPGLMPSTCGFVHETLSASLFPRYAIKALARAVRNRGGQIHENLRYATGDRHAKITVITAGYESAALLPDQIAALLQGVKGQSALLDTGELALPMVYDDGIYIVPQGPHGTAIGSTSERNWQSAEQTDNQLDALIERARVLMPALRTATVTHRWAGIRPRGRLPDPLIGEIEEGLWLATGGFKVGLGLAPEIARRLAAHLDGEETNFPQSFRLSTHLAR